MYAKSDSINSKILINNTLIFNNQANLGGFLYA